MYDNRSFEYIYIYIFWGVRDLETNFLLMNGFFARLYNLLLHVTNHYMTLCLLVYFLSASGRTQEKTSLPNNSFIVTETYLPRRCIEMTVLLLLHAC
jgi:hypothetical protein